MRFESLIALAMFLAIPGEALCRDRGYQTLREQVPRDYRLREYAPHHHIVVYTQENFGGFGTQIDYYEGECTNIQPSTPERIKSIRIRDGIECTFWYEWGTCQGRNFVLSDPDEGEAIPFWPGSFKCSPAHQ
ncbi:hypothetical protein BGZ93_003284, partial [Podila epicladia]